MQVFISQKYLMEFNGTVSFPNQSLHRINRKRENWWTRNIIPNEQLRVGTWVEIYRTKLTPSWDPISLLNGFIWTGLHFSVFRWHMRHFGKTLRKFNSRFKIVRYRRWTIQLFSLPLNKTNKNKTSDELMKRDLINTMTSSTRWPHQLETETTIFTS